MIDQPAPGWVIYYHRVSCPRREHPDREGLQHSEGKYLAKTQRYSEILSPVFRHRHEAVRWTHDYMKKFGWSQRRKRFQSTYGHALFPEAVG